MSFINLEFMGIQSPDIMADSVDTKQMFVVLDNKPTQRGSILAFCYARGNNTS